MTEFTDYNKYELPEPFNINERNEWGRILNDALDQLDDDIILRGSLTQRPNASENNRLFLDEQSNLVYRDTGSSWQLLGSQLTFRDSGASIVTNPTNLDFDKAFTVTNPSDNTVEVNVSDDFIENSGDSMEGILDLNSNNLEDDAQTIWNASSEFIEQAVLENDSFTLTAGDGLKNAGSVALGSSITIDIEPSDFAGVGVKDDGSDNITVEPSGFAGSYLSDDGSDNLTVNLSDGLEGDGTGSIRTDEDFSHTWTSSQKFDGGLTLGGSLDASSQSITGLPEPTNTNDAARKQYVDSLSQGLSLKDSVKVSNHDQNIDLTSSTDPNPVDGYTLSDGDRILIKHQTDATENGIYDVVDATDPTTWVRSSDFDEDSEVVAGSFTFVENGTHANESYIQTTEDPVLGTDPLEFSLFARAGDIQAGDGLTKSGDTLNILPSDFAGTFLSDDGSDNLTVDLGFGVEDDGSGNIRFDEDASLTLTSELTASNGVEVGGDISDGATVIYDSSASQIEQDTLENDSVTISPGTQLTGGGSVALGESVTLNVDENGLDADTVDGFEASELRAANNIAQLSSTNTSLDINKSSWTSIPFDVQLKLDSAYTHDASSTPETITFDEAGTYRVEVSLAYERVFGSRVNPGIKFNVNGTRLDTFGLTGYVRSNSGHAEASNTVARVIDVNAGDTLQVQTIQMASTGTVTMRSNESVLIIEQASASTALASDADTLDGLDSTAFVKTDGSTPITSAQAINQSNDNDYLRFNNTTSGDTWDVKIDSSDSFVLDRDASTVLSIDNSTDQVTFTNRVYASTGFDAGSDSMDNITEVNTIGSGSASFDVYDSANAQTIASFVEGSGLDLNENDITNIRSVGKSPVVSGTTYEIQKDGTDGSGIINFKTN